ncbi:MAG: PAS domain-containing protein [Vicinamibacterales bacterium]|nr:PAS domain-containing protein [Vicinamibacterales bacterium]
MKRREPRNPTRKPRRSPTLAKALTGIHGLDEPTGGGLPKGRPTLLVAAERLARSILEQAAEAIVVCDEQGRVVRASQAVERLCDGSPLRRPFAEVFPLRIDAADPFHLAPVLQGETLRNVDVALDRQGQEFHLILNAGPLLSDQQIVGCVVTLTDITERKRATETEARLVTILEATPDLVAIADPEGWFVDMNRAGRKMLGIDESTDLAKHNLLEFHDAANAHVVLTEGIPTAIREGAWSGETELVALDGHAIVVSQVILAHKAPNGTLAFLSTIARDITERRRAEGELRRMSTRLAVVLDNITDGFFTLDRELRYTDINISGAAMVGRTPAQLVGRRLLDEFPQAADTSFVRAYRRVSETGKACVVEDYYAPIDRWFEARVPPFADGVSVFFSDITDRTRADEAREHREAELQESQRIAGIGSWEWTIATGVVRWSEGMNHLLGRDRGSPAPTFETLASFYTPESWEQLGAAIARTIEMGALYELELEMVRADGTTCWTTTRGARQYAGRMAPW